MDTAAPPDRTDLSLSTWQATLVGVVLTPIIGAAVFGVHILIWGTGSLIAATVVFRNLGLVLPVLGISIILHEGLHLAGYRMFGRIPAGKAVFGFTLWPLTAYIHADDPIAASAYRLLVALPGLALGAVPALIGIVSGIGWVTLYGFFMLISAGGDAAILWKIRRVPSDALVLDHPRRAGCWLLHATGPQPAQNLPPSPGR